MDLAKLKTQKFNQLSRHYRQIKVIWTNASASYTRFTLWSGIIIPSMFINLLMLTLPLAMLQAYDRIIPNNSTQSLTLLIIIVVIATIIEMILRSLRSIICNWAFAREDYLQISKLSETILQAKMSTQENTERETILTYSDLINRTKQSHNEQTIVNILDLIFVCIFLLLIAYLSGMLVLVPLVLMATLAWKIYKRDDQLKSQLQKQKEFERKRISSIVDALSGIFTLKAMAMEPSILRRSEFLELKKAESIYDTNLTNMEINALVSLFSQLIFFLTVAIGALFVMYHSLTVGALAACTLLAGRGMQPITRFIGLWGQKKDTQASQSFLKKISSLEKETFNENGLQKTLDGKILFDHVRIVNQKNNNSIIEEFTLDIAPREIICIQDDGACAWSLFYVLMKFMPPAQGCIMVDDININDFDLQNLRSQICYLSKEGVLYNGTILENISNFNATKEALAREIAMQIGLENVISKFPQGYQTKAGPNAAQIFSAGFRQLVSFVRMMVSSPKIALFNNITFNVDKQTIRLLINAINLYKNNMTMIIATMEPALFTIAHRNFAIQNKKLEET